MRPPPPTAATMRARRMMDAMTCTELPATAMGPPHELRRRCLWLIRQEPFCLAIAVEDGQTEYIFECRANIVANGHHKRADQSRTEWIEFCQKFRFEIYVFRLLRFQTITDRKFRKKQSEQECYESGYSRKLGTDGNQTIF